MRISLAKNIDKTITLQGKFIKFGNRRRNNKKGLKTTMLIKQLKLIEPISEGTISHMWIDYNNNFCWVKEGDIIQFTGKVRRYTKTIKLKLYFRSGINRVIKVDYFVDSCDNVKIIKNTYGYTYLDKNLNKIILLRGRFIKSKRFKKKNSKSITTIKLVLLEDLTPIDKSYSYKIPKLWVDYDNAFQEAENGDIVEFICEIKPVSKPIIYNVIIDGVNEIIKRDYHFTKIDDIKIFNIKDYINPDLNQKINLIFDKMANDNNLQETLTFND